MSYSNYLMKMDWLVKLLKQENTGSADFLACKLRVSRRTIFRYFDELRLNGAIISYSKSKGTYYLENKFTFTEDFLMSAIKWHSPSLNLGSKTTDNQY